MKTEIKQKELKLNNETLRKRVKEGDFKDIENWDISNVTNMNGLFFDERFNEFNEDSVTPLVMLLCFIQFLAILILCKNHFPRFLLRI
jgi:hypothetical protein